MTWAAYLYDTMTGVVGDPIDLPSFSWSMNVNNSSLCTTRDRAIGDGTATGLTLPWSAVPGRTGSEKARNIATLRQSIVLMWRDGNGVERPVLVGAIGSRTDTMQDTSFDLISPLDLLDNRVLVEEGTFGAVVSTSKAKNGKITKTCRTTSKIEYKNLSQRAIACDVIRRCTESKPGGLLPIDLPYLNEEFIHYQSDGKTANQNYWRTYYGYNVANDSCKDILEKLGSTSYGPDMQFRPYMVDASHVRLRFEAGSDGNIYLDQTGVLPTFTHFWGGGTLQDCKVTHDYPAERVYGTGSGTDEAMNCYLAENLSLVRQEDPWPLVELTRADTNVSGSSIAATYDAVLEAKRKPILQLRGTVDLNDANVPTLGTWWPGQLADVDLRDFPSIPDGTYRLRVMELSGSSSSSVTVLFDLIEDPIW